VGELVNKTKIVAHFSSKISVATALLLSPKLPFWKARTTGKLVVTVIGQEGMLIYHYVFLHVQILTWDAVVEQY
jgi:hypothetical protein